METKKEYTQQELMKIFNVSRFAIYRAVKSGKLKVDHKRGTELVFTYDEVMKYIMQKG